MTVSRRLNHEPSGSARNGDNKPSGQKKAQAEIRLRPSDQAARLLGGNDDKGIALFAVSARIALGTVITGRTGSSGCAC